MVPCCAGAGGTNMRKLLVGNGINVYRSLTRWTNCNGKQRCGTCIVEVNTATLLSLSCSMHSCRLRTALTTAPAAHSTRSRLFGKILRTTGFRASRQSTAMSLLECLGRSGLRSGRSSISCTIFIDSMLSFGSGGRNCSILC